MEEKRKTSKRYSAEVRERAVRLLREALKDHASKWAAIESISSKIGCSGETLRGWLRQAERDGGERDGMTTEDRARTSGWNTWSRSSGGRSTARGQRS